MATQSAEGSFSLIEEGGFVSPHGPSGSRQQSIKPPQPTLGDRCQFLMTGEVEEDDSPKWISPGLMAFLVLMIIIAFVLSCVGVDMARSNSRSIKSMETNMAALTATQDTYGALDCSQGDIIWGQTPVAGSAAWYQIIGGSEATLSWFEVRSSCCISLLVPGPLTTFVLTADRAPLPRAFQALRDAESRCYNGVQGSLAWIESPEEDAFLMELIRSNNGYEHKLCMCVQKPSVKRITYVVNQPTR